MTASQTLGGNGTGRRDFECIGHTGCNQLSDEVFLRRLTGRRGCWLTALLAVFTTRILEHILRSLIHTIAKAHARLLFSLCVFTIAFLCLFEVLLTFALTEFVGRLTRLIESFFLCTTALLTFDILSACILEVRKLDVLDAFGILYSLVDCVCAHPW